MCKMKVLIAIPTYNERKNIEDLFRTIWKEIPQAHILVVDDNSPDGTAKKVQFLQKTFPTQLHLLQRSQKEGLGKAYLAAFKWFLQREDYQVLVQMDADFSHRPQDLPSLLNPLTNPNPQAGADVVKADAVVGSRYIRGGQVENWTFFRRTLSQLGSLYSSLILSPALKDWTGGFNAWKREVLSELDLEDISSQGYVFQIELKGRALHRGFKLVEAPICFACRRAGTSKMSSSIIWEALFRVWQIRRKVFKKPFSWKFLKWSLLFFFFSLFSLTTHANSKSLQLRDPLPGPYPVLKKPSKYQYGKINLPEVYVRKKPHPQSKILSQLNFGEIYFISKRIKNKFYKIKFRKRTFGYIPAKGVQALGLKGPLSKRKSSSSEKKEYLFFESFAGLQWVQMNWSEKRDWGRSSAPISFVGLKITVPNLFFEGPVFDMHLLMNTATPPYYKERTGEEASATFVMWDGLLLLPLKANLDNTLVLGLGPILKYSDIIWSKKQNDLQEGSFQWGIAFTVGYSLRLWRKHCLKLETKHASYNGPSLSHNGFALSWQLLF